MIILTDRLDTTTAPLPKENLSDIPAEYAGACVIAGRHGGELPFAGLRCRMRISAAIW